MDFFIIVLLFGIVVVVTHFLEGVTGFGCTVLAMPFCIALVGIEVAKPVLTIYAWLLALYIVIRSFKKIDFKVFFQMIALLLLGLPIGIALYNYLNEQLLMFVLALFMILVSVRGLLKNFKVFKKPNAIPEKIGLFLVFLGGIIHGAYSSGGPLTIIYATEKIKDKSTFRATLCLIWATLNSIILIQMLLSNQLTQQVGELSLYVFPFLIFGTIVGDIAHVKIKDTVFTTITYLTLLASGIFMII